MAYKQKQGRNSFPKTGRGITSKLAGPGDPPKFTQPGLAKRVDQLGKNIVDGKASASESGQQLQRLFNIATNKDVKSNYNLYQKDSTIAANRTPYKYRNNPKEKEVGKMISDRSKDMFKEFFEK